MEFQDFPMFLGKSGKYEIHPPKLCASLGHTRGPARERSAAPAERDRRETLAERDRRDGCVRRCAGLCSEKSREGGAS